VAFGPAARSDRKIADPETCGFGLYQPQRELTIGASVARDKVPDVLGDGGACDIAAGLNFERDIFRDVLRPMLKRVEGDNADRVDELSRHQIGDDGFEVGPLNFGLAVNGVAAKAVDNEEGNLIRPLRHDPWRPACSRHTQLPRNNSPNLSTKQGIVPAKLCVALPPIGDFMMADNPTPIASYAAGQIAIQTLLSVLINLYIGECEDRDLAKREITGAAEDMIDKASVPDLPAADQKEARDQANS
jgi:hypothetical protein